MVCHDTVMGTKRQVLGAVGDFRKKSHHVVDYGNKSSEIVTDADCLVCHKMKDQLNGVSRLEHKDSAGEVIQ